MPDNTVVNLADKRREKAKQQKKKTAPKNDTKPPKKRDIKILQAALDITIKDGFSPQIQDIKAKFTQAETELARRTKTPAKIIHHLITDGALEINHKEFNPKDPHGTMLRAWREAGLEVIGNDLNRKQIIRLKEQNRILETTLERIERDNLTTAEIREKIYGLSNAKPEIPQWLKPDRKTSGNPGVPMTLWSDWHYGEVVTAEEMAGKNQYNLKIADQRIDVLVHEIIDITRRNNKGFQKYPGIVVALGGDMISGDDLHDELTVTNQNRTISVLGKLQGRLIWGLRQLADEFGQVYVPCVVGNHGRNTKKPRFKQRNETNYEFLLYNQLELFFQNDPNYKDKIKFNIAQDTGVHFNVSGHRYHLQHGDTLGVKGGDGIIGALGPIMRGKIKVGASEASIDKPFDTILLGHWHTYISLKGLIVNGSMKGWDEYARFALRVPYDPPIQALWFNHPTLGPVQHNKIVLEKPRNAPNTTPDVFSSPRRGNDPTPITPQNPRRPARNTGDQVASIA